MDECKPLHAGAPPVEPLLVIIECDGRGLHWFTFQLNLSRV